MTRFPFLAIALLALASTARADDAPGIPDLKVEKYTLPNGLEVILHEDHTTPVVGGQHLVQGRLEEREDRADRVRPPVRAPDVPGLAAPRQGVLRPAREARRPDQRQHQHRPHELLRDRAEQRAWSWPSGSSPTAWASCFRP